MHEMGINYKLIFSDFNMPQMDGIKATQLMRQYLTAQQVMREQQPTIVGVTGYINDKFKNKGKEAGMDDVIEKPCYYEEIRKILISNKLI